LIEAKGQLVNKVVSPATGNVMRAAVIAGPGRMTVETVSIPEPGPHQIRVRLQGCGICASNLDVWAGRPWFKYPMDPGSPGHEGWGIVDSVGNAVGEFSSGERVAMLSQRAYAEYDVADAASVIKLPEALWEKPFPGEPLACAMNVFRRSEIKNGQTVAIVGVGFLGAVLTRLAYLAGARVVAISRRPFALEVAKAVGAMYTIAMGNHARIIEDVMMRTGGVGCDCVIEAVGKQGPLDLAAELTRERGRLVIAGYHQDGPRTVNMQLWNWRGLDVVNAHERDPDVYMSGMQAAIDAVANGDLDPSILFSHVFTLDHLADAFDAARDRPDGFLKGLLVL
jgi:threonine dehydrogenase-like Zn-dependent dehydrogenase